MGGFEIEEERIKIMSKLNDEQREILRILVVDKNLFRN